MLLSRPVPVSAGLYAPAPGVESSSLPGDVGFFRWLDNFSSHFLRLQPIQLECFWLGSARSSPDRLGAQPAWLWIAFPYDFR